MAMRRTFLSAVCVCGLLVLGASAQQMELHAGWAVQSSAKVEAAPAAVSEPGFATAGWLPASVPTTVFNALIENKLEPDPDYGMNLRQAKGVEYKIGANYSHLELPADSPYAVPWWFRKEFTVPAAWNDKTLWLDFHGINYRANIWLNGKLLASEEQARGTFRRFEYNVTGIAHPGANALAVEVYAPRVHDLAITFVDWNPMPPDKDMGLWGKVVLRASGPVAIRDPWVRSALPLPATARAHLVVSATLVNGTAAEQTGTLRGSAAGHSFARRVALEPGERRMVRFEFEVEHPRLWWPAGMGKPEMYPLRLAFAEGGRTSDRSDTEFGIDQIEARKNAQGSEQFYVNGRKLFVRGGGWTPDMLLRDGPAKWANDFRYARLLGLNTIRLEGKLMDNAFFDLADRNGILIMAGWCCCDHWEEWGGWKDDEREVATASLRDQATRLRGHPSLLVWLNGSDNPPPEAIERAYLDVLASVEWPRPVLSSASAKVTRATGHSGVKMTGPYDYVPPVYWLAEPQLGGARGFNTETSMGAAIPPVESLREFLPAAHLWTGAGAGLGADDPYWTFHAGSGNFLNLRRYQTALDARYGAAGSLHAFVWESQAMSYEGERAMFEAFGRRQGEATGVVQWMLDNGWPSLIWHLYDYYLRPGAGFYGVERANEPLHAQYADFDREITLVNHTLRPSRGTTVTAEVFDLAGKRIFAHRYAAQAGAESSADLGRLPAFPGVVFLRLTLPGAAPNLYWLSDKPDKIDLKAATWFYAPEASSADFRALASLPPATVRVQAQLGAAAGAVTVTNTGSTVAFLAHLRLLRGTREVLPVWWGDNYVTLMPHETRRLAVRYPAGAAPRAVADGWNVNVN